MAAKARENAVSVPANDVDEPAVSPAAASRASKTSKTDGSGYLTMYFRDMATLAALRRAVGPADQGASVFGGLTPEHFGMPAFATQEVGQ